MKDQQTVARTSMTETCSWNSISRFIASILLNKTFITLGIRPVCNPAFRPVPMVYVLLDPVCSTSQWNLTISNSQTNWNQHCRLPIMLEILTQMEYKAYLSIGENRSIIPLKQVINQWCNTLIKHSCRGRAGATIDMIKCKWMCANLHLQRTVIEIKRKQGFPIK